MATVRNLIVVLAALVCFGLMSEAAELDDLKVRLTSLEDSQQRLREVMSHLETRIDSDVDNVTQFCQDLRMRVQEQRQLLDSLREVVAGRSTSSPRFSTPLSTAVTSSSPVTPSFDNCGPCSPDNYTVIDDARRLVKDEYSGYEDMCDNRMEPGWYRFLVDGEKATIPTSCVPEYYCHTDAPTWLDLEGQSLPAMGQQVDARACSHWNDDCCNWEAPVTVLNCGEFYVYKLNPLSTCNLAFCVE